MELPLGTLNLYHLRNSNLALPHYYRKNNHGRLISVMRGNDEIDPVMAYGTYKDYEYKLQKKLITMHVTKSISSTVERPT